MKVFRERLLWKLLLINAPVIGVIILLIWLAIDQLAAGYFMALMKKYDISPDDIHHMFLTSVHYYLLWASFVALGLAFVLSFLLTRRVLKPLAQMNTITHDIAAGNFAMRVEVATKDEIGELGRSFNRMADSLQCIEQLRKNMVADVAHELRTPLTNLRGYLEALNDQVITPSPEILRMLQDETLRLVKLVDNLQQLTRAEAARHHIQKEKICVSRQIDDLLALYASDFQKKRIVIEKNFSPDADVLEVDRDKFLQAVRNILDNCLKYTPENGRLTIAATPKNNTVELIFCNDGPAIAAADLPFLFERFFRVDRSRSRDIGGAGIGLSITKELIEAHGGQVSAESLPDQTCIRVALPS